MTETIPAQPRDDGRTEGQCWDCGATTERECAECTVPVCPDCASNGNHAANCA